MKITGSLIFCSQEAEVFVSSGPVVALRCGKAVQMHCQFVAMHCQLHCLYFRIRKSRIGLIAY